jgi:hypothetical protein
LILFLGIHCCYLFLGFFLFDLFLFFFNLLLCQFSLLVEFDNTNQSYETNNADNTRYTACSRSFCELCRVACLDIRSFTSNNVPKPANIR